MYAGNDVLQYPISLLTIATLELSLTRLASHRLSDTTCNMCTLTQFVDVDELMSDTDAAVEDVRGVSGWCEEVVERCKGWVGVLVEAEEGRGGRGAKVTSCSSLAIARATLLRGRASSAATHFHLHQPMLSVHV